MTGVVRYRVRHETVYSYGGNVAHSHQLLHLTPRDGPLQTCHRRSLTLVPLPGTLREDIDSFGNYVTRLEYDSPHDRLEVLAEVSVDVRSAPAITAADGVSWETVRDALSFSGQPMSAELLDACRYRMESSYVRIKQTFGDYGAECFTPGRPMLAAAEARLPARARLGGAVRQRIPADLAAPRCGRRLRGC